MFREARIRFAFFYKIFGQEFTSENGLSSTKLTCWSQRRNPLYVFNCLMGQFPGKDGLKQNRLNWFHATGFASEHIACWVSQGGWMWTPSLLKEYPDMFLNTKDIPYFVVFCFFLRISLKWTALHSSSPLDPRNWKPHHLQALKPGTVPRVQDLREWRSLVLHTESSRPGTLHSGVGKGEMGHVIVRWSSQKYTC